MTTITETIVTSKICSKCKVEKELSFFYKNKTKSLGICNECKECFNLYLKSPKAKELKQKRRNLPENKAKEKEAYKEYYHRPEINQRYQEYRNTDEVKERVKIYFQRDDIKERVKQRLEDCRPKRNERIRNKYNSDENYRLITILRSKIHKMLKGIHTSYENILGCNLDFFKKWIEFRFDENMTWENLGEYWELDHILPISSFDFNKDNDTNICFHWINIQPLQKTENRSKSAKLQLHYYFNNIVNVNRFNTKYNQFNGYQVLNESLRWLRDNELRYGKNPTDEVNNIFTEMDNPQPSL